MIFLYRPLISAAPDSDDFLLILRPEIAVTVVGPAGSATYSGLVDTGSDNTILPFSIAHDLGIQVQPAPGPPANVFGGHQVQLLVGEITLQIQDENEIVRWRDIVSFFDFQQRDDETVILGHSGFLDYFTATFDGKAGALTLTANDELPVA
jgi:hypothetical protein